ncbi:hypothetical protein SISNIDRAFT_436884 [Sistotremastrum niveocremeum HHB9708]|uniref:Alpha/beta-hydrolase n=2 Tax=Sistotremastraceae TaxID=3402574 RepID=A0A164ZTQ1_9AGAM|nr:hypothetical protein SISNIDRAFT_436884 [Sistotremastrum niveocremeum HHB9708]KZT38336.1 hypothetical protein SISSUDRAFT_1113972 [Sistotremastrum suecicum HHB10207 ss-3]
MDVSEIPRPTPSRDWSYYLVLCFAIAPIWLIAPLSWLYVLSSLATTHISLLYNSTLFLLASLEVAFSIYHLYLHRVVDGPSPVIMSDFMTLQAAFHRILQTGLAHLSESDDPLHPEHGHRPTSPAETLVQLDKDDPRAVDFRDRLRTWFGHVPFSHIHAHELKQWLHWSSFNSLMPTAGSLSLTNETAIQEAFTMLQMRCGVKIPEGSNPAVKPLLLTLDSVNVRGRPLVWYVLVKALNMGLRSWFDFRYGVSYFTHGDLEYIVRMPRSYDIRNGPNPVVFIHGLGLGLFQYQLLLSELFSKLPDHPVLIPLQPHISQDIFHPHFLTPKPRVETVRTFTAVIEQLGWHEKGVTCISHSNGSYAHAWLLKECSHLIKRSCFVDPVTFCSWEGDVCYNFVYKPCYSGFNLLMRYFVGTEIGVANLIQRHFDWSSNSLFFEEIPNACDPEKTMYILGGQDAIVNAERVSKYLRSHGVRDGLRLNPDAKHGEALIAGREGLHEVLDWIQEGQPLKKNKTTS